MLRGGHKGSVIENPQVWKLGVAPARDSVNQKRKSSAGGGLRLGRTAFRPAPLKQRGDKKDAGLQAADRIETNH